MFKLTLLFIFLLSNLFSQNYIDRNFVGEIDIFNQTENLTCFSTIYESDKYYLYVMTINDSIYFKKQLEERPRDIIVSEKYRKIILCFYDQSGEFSHGESYSYIMFKIDNGDKENFPPLFTYLKLATGGEYLFASTHLFDNASPLDVYNISNGEHFKIELRDWIRVTSMSGNRLVILQQLAERNEKKVKYELKLSEKRKSHLNQSRLNKNRYTKGKISENRFLEIEDSLNNDYKLFQSNEPIGSSTQLGTMMWIYDLDKKYFVHTLELKDKSGNSIVMHRDDRNLYSLSVDKNDIIQIIGHRKNSNERHREKILLKYDSNFELIEDKLN
jgi:hypothetical protein